LEELMNDPDTEKADRVTKAMLRMEKIDIAGLQAAHDQA
jgi:predicted 3-demethylubiquinone-9 3-methyltransferase (glyoxalase superfamily)